MPRGRGTRPTSDRAREGLFSTLESTFGTLDDLRFVDAYAGSGAVGLEALSRGAAHVLFIESAAPALQALRRNIDNLTLKDTVVAARAVRTVLGERPDAPYDAFFADPPYAIDPAELADVLDLAARWLAPDGVLVVERASRDGEPPWPPTVSDVRSRRYGDTTLWYGRRS